jgi:anti-anti-sigma factor
MPFACWSEPPNPAPQAALRRHRRSRNGGTSRQDVPVTTLDRPVAGRPKTYRLELTLSAAQSFVALVGDIDLAARADLTRLFDSLDVLTVPIRVDMSAVTFLDSSGLAPLIEATRRRMTSHSPLFVVKQSLPVRRLLALLGTTDNPVLDVRARWIGRSATPGKSRLRALRPCLAGSCR